jgi:hypothetical protein
MCASCAERTTARWPGSRDRALLQVLLKAGADPTKAVHIAVAEGHDDMLQDLLDAGADHMVAFRLAVERQVFHVSVVLVSQKSGSYVLPGPSKSPSDRRRVSFSTEGWCRKDAGSSGCERSERGHSLLYLINHWL